MRSGMSPISHLVEKHKIWIFDCDGVILDSNSIKTEAFFEICLPYGTKEAELMVDYHRAHGGISRFQKFNWFLEAILQRKIDPNEHKRLCENYGNLVKNKLLTCDYTGGFIEALDRLKASQIKPYVVSGGFETELIEIFTNRGLLDCFSGVFGSPRNKIEILSDMSSAGVELGSGLFIGDSKVDYDASIAFGMEFVFLRKYSEAIPWFESSCTGVQSFFTFEEMLVLS
jgi:phosphoglycolate phosphatase-like HAD superfamily hydrolase